MLVARKTILRAAPPNSSAYLSFFFRIGNFTSVNSSPSTAIVTLALASRIWAG